VVELAGTCALIVAEGAPARYAPLQEMMAGVCWDRLVDQLTALDLDALGVMFGALHIPAVVDCLTEKHGYRVANARWLMVARAS
jgi:hypothetical protein